MGLIGHDSLLSLHVFLGQYGHNPRSDAILTEIPGLMPGFAAIRSATHFTRPPTILDGLAKLGCLRNQSSPTHHQNASDSCLAALLLSGVNEWLDSLRQSIRPFVEKLTGMLRGELYGARVNHNQHGRQQRVYGQPFNGSTGTPAILNFGRYARINSVSTALACFSLLQLIISNRHPSTSNARRSDSCAASEIQARIFFADPM